MIDVTLMTKRYNYDKFHDDAWTQQLKTVQLLIKDLLTDLQYLYDTLQAKGNEFDHVIKMGRTHLQDAVPIRLAKS